MITEMEYGAPHQAVDGDVTTCVKTIPNELGMLRIDLQAGVLSTSVNVIGRTGESYSYDNQRLGLDGVSVYTSTPHHNEGVKTRIAHVDGSTVEGFCSDLNDQSCLENHAAGSSEVVKLANRDHRGFCEYKDGAVRAVLEDSSCSATCGGSSGAAVNSGCTFPFAHNGKVYDRCVPLEGVSTEDACFLEDVTLITLIDVNDARNANPTGSYPMPECHGECDADSNCAGDLECFQRNNYEQIPGCAVGGPDDVKGWDICYDPTRMTDTEWGNCNCGEEDDFKPVVGMWASLDGDSSKACCSGRCVTCTNLEHSNVAPGEGSPKQLFQAPISQTCGVSVYTLSSEEDMKDVKLQIGLKVADSDSDLDVCEVELYVDDGSGGEVQVRNCQERTTS